MTEPLTAGPFTGTTYIPSPLPLNGGFLTDNRNFHKRVGAPSRVHARVVIDLQRQTLRDWHRCGETIGVHRHTGEELCRARESTDRVFVSDVVWEDNPKSLGFHLQGSCSNPCVALAPSVDFLLDVHLTAKKGRWDQDIAIDVSGHVEPFPAFEMYVRRSKEKRPYTLLRVPVEPGASLLSMLGPANRPVEGHLLLPGTIEGHAVFP